jgi:hypothetical protein
MFWTPVSPKKKEAPEPEERGEIANVPEEARGGLSLLNLLPSYACVVSGERTVLWANKAMKRDMGLVPGMRCFEVHWLREEPCGECPLEMVASTGKSFCWEQSIENPQTGKIQVLSQLISLPWGFARGRCFLEISTDVTLFKRRQSQLELSQREYKALFEGVPCYISVQDRDFRIIKQTVSSRRSSEEPLAGNATRFTKEGTRSAIPARWRGPLSMARYTSARRQ